MNPPVAATVVAAWVAWAAWISDYRPTCSVAIIHRIRSPCGRSIRRSNRQFRKLKVPASAGIFLMDGTAARRSRSDRGMLLLRVIGQCREPGLRQTAPRRPIARAGRRQTRPRRQHRSPWPAVFWPSWLLRVTAAPAEVQREDPGPTKAADCRTG